MDGARGDLCVVRTGERNPTGARHAVTCPNCR
jgi:hypothetical protein